MKEVIYEKNERLSVLNMDQERTFGIEIEFERARLSDVRACLKSFSDWRVKEEVSIYSNLYDVDWDPIGGEVTSPILTNQNGTWEALDEVCQSIIDCGGTVGNKTAAHLHFGIETLPMQKKIILRFLKLYTLYESVLFRCGYGHFLQPRGSLLFYSAPMRASFLYHLEEFDKDDVTLQGMIDELQGYRNRYYALDFHNVDLKNISKPKNTIEFRYFNGTLDPAVWQVNVLTVSSMWDYAASNSFDDEKIKYQLKKIKCFKNVNLYEYNLKKAIEFASMVFPYDIDQDRFLIQYVKNGKKIKR